ncbi:hypothetical protein Dimus_026918 [Dionaea muscipula]
MDLPYMEYLTAKLPINLPRVMIRHMSYVISVLQHELPYGELLTRVFEAFEVLLNDKEGDEPKRYDFFKETRSSGSGEHIEKQVKRDADSGSGDRFYDAIDDVRSVDEEIVAPAAPVVNDPAPIAPVDTPAVQETPAMPASPAASTSVKKKGKIMTPAAGDCGSSSFNKCEKQVFDQRQLVIPVPLPVQ